MSTLKVNKITNATDNGPIEFTNGVILPAGQSITSDSLIINTVGVVTASSFSGVGVGITNLAGIPKASVYAVLSII